MTRREPSRAPESTALWAVPDSIILPLTRSSCVKYSFQLAQIS